MDIFFTILEWLFLIGLFGWWTWYCLVPIGLSIKQLALKYVYSIILCLAYAFVAGGGPFALVFFGTFLLVLFAAVWREALTELTGGWVGGLFDGGSQQVDKKPLLNQAEALRVSGKPRDAIRAARDALQVMPDDFDTHMFIAAVQAEDIDRLDRAADTIEDALRGKRIERGQIVYALNTMADWHIKAVDPDAAKACLTCIMETMPDTEPAQCAEQRIIRMRSREDMLKDAQPKTLVMPEFEKDLGLKGKQSKVKRKGSDPREIVAELEAQLKKHPNDWTAREELATFMAEHHKNVRLAVEEMEKLLSGSKAPRQEVARWLHMMADWQTRIDRDTDAARETLKRIVTLYPDTAIAHRAETAIAHLRERR